MRKTFYLHIGHYKTGTTALQTFLTGNQRKLMRQGLDYPADMRVHSKHSKLAFSIYRKAGVETLMHGYRDPTPPEDVWARMFDYVTASRAPHVLVSTEEFMRMGAHPRAGEILAEIIEGARDRFDFRVIAYLRSPGAHLRSWYNQLVKMKTAPPDFNTAVTQVMEPIHYDYALAMKPWLEIFGEGAVTLRPYQKGMPDGDGLFRDFLSQLGVAYDRTPPGGWRMPERDVNPRLDERTLELHRAMRDAGLPERLRDWIAHRAEKLLLDTPFEPADFSEIVVRARAGLAALETLPGNSMETAAFVADLPTSDPVWQAELTRMVTVLLREQDILRTRLQSRNTELLARMKATETRLDALERRLSSE